VIRIVPARRVVVIADSHLSERSPEAEANWDAVANHARAVGAHLVVHAGDLTLDGVEAPEELPFARRRLDELGLPWVAVPGNHDIGDNPGVSAGPEITTERLERWRDTIGADWWAVDLDGWTLLGVNAQLFGSDLPAAAAQWKWLEDELGEERSNRAVLFVSHKPLTAPAAELDAAPPYRFVPRAAGDRLSTLLSGRDVPLVVSGHVHQFRRLDLDDRTHVWAPTSWAVLPEQAQPTFGEKRCGVAALTLGDDDQGAVTVELVEPVGMRQLTIGVDIPNPYTH
jgi:3',5'-cyclic AMP phosphodiesterase CpdA